MNIELDSLKYAKMLASHGYTISQAEGLIACLTQFEVRNIYSKDEVNTMLNEAIEKTFEKFEERFEKQDKAHEMALQARLAEQRREFDKRLKIYERHIDSDIAELRAGRRWVVGTIITVGLALAGYLSALIHFTH